MSKARRLVARALTCIALAARAAAAQEKYEIEVYGAETVAPRFVMLELHSNFTFASQTRYLTTLAPTNHALHETVEATLGVSSWSEVALYVLTSAQNGLGTQWVGDHARAKVRVPESWGWPVGIGLSTEVGYERPSYSRDTWTWEISPIVDRYRGRWYAAFNPTVERTLRGPGVHDGIEFAPSGKVTYDFTQRVSAGIEYYGASDEFGVVHFGGLDPGGLTKDSLPKFERVPSIAASRAPDPDEGPTVVRARQHQLFGAVDLHVSQLWEINFGLGVGATQSTDRLLAKLIVGRQISWGRGAAP